MNLLNGAGLLVGEVEEDHAALQLGRVADRLDVALVLREQRPQRLRPRTRSAAISASGRLTRSPMNRSASSGSRLFSMKVISCSAGSFSSTAILASGTARRR